MSLNPWVSRNLSKLMCTNEYHSAPRSLGVFNVGCVALTQRITSVCCIIVLMLPLLSIQFSSVLHPSSTRVSVIDVVAVWHLGHAWWLVGGQKKGGG